MTRRIGRVVLVVAGTLEAVVVLGGKCWQDSGKPHHWWQLYSGKSSLSCVCVALETLMEIELLSNQFNFFFKQSFLE